MTPIPTPETSRARRELEALECGLVGIDIRLISTEVAPLGGLKQSGTGGEGSKNGLLDHTEPKCACIGGI